MKTLFRFVIKSFEFSFTSSDISAISGFVKRTELHRLSTYDLYDTMYNYSKEGLLYISDLKIWLKQVISPNANIDDHEVVYEFFRTFDRNNSDAVDIIEFITGLSVFCHGRKSEKLAFAFDLMDDDKDSMLTKRGLWRYFRSFLAILITSSGAFHKVGLEKANLYLDDCAVFTTSEVIKGVTSQGKDIPGVTFEEIADWYARDGHSRATWLELLDLKKWLSVNEDDMNGDDDLDEDSLEEKESKMQYNEYDDEDDVEGNSNGRSGSIDVDSSMDRTLDSSVNTDDSAYYEPGMLQFDITLDEENSLTIYEGDADRVLNVITVFSMFQKDTLHFRGQLQNFIRQDNNYMSREAFLSLFIDEIDDSKQREDALNVLDDIFTIFSSNYGKNGEVKFGVILTGLSIFCRGSKSEKLEIAFKTFCDEFKNESGRLDVLTVDIFLQTFLTVLVTVSSHTSMSRGFASIQDVCSRLARSICGNNGSANFTDFSLWYNSGGHRDASWIELIDLTKWVRVEYPEDTYDSPYVDVGDQISLRLPSASDPITISKISAAYVFNFAKDLELNTYTPEEVKILFYTKADDGLITLEDFDACVRKLTAKAKPGLGQRETDEYAMLLHYFFYAFDRTGKGEVVDVTDLCSGFAILCKGNKSEKLAYVFDLMDDDQDGELTRRGLWRFFRSFLCSLLSLSGAISNLSFDETADLLDRSSRRTCESIFKTIGPRDALISFNDIADWYSVCCEEFPWLELLDLAKWSQLAQS